MVLFCIPKQADGNNTLSLGDGAGENGLKPPDKQHSPLCKGHFPLSEKFLFTALQFLFYDLR